MERLLSADLAHQVDLLRVSESLILVGIILAVIDCGVKENILRSLVGRGSSVTVLPFDYPIHKKGCLVLTWRTKWICSGSVKASSSLASYSSPTVIPLPRCCHRLWCEGEHSPQLGGPWFQRHCPSLRLPQAQADTENGDLGGLHQTLEVVDGVLAVGWVTGAVGSSTVV
jgi:hypothetical protein